MLNDLRCYSKNDYLEVYKIWGLLQWENCTPKISMLVQNLEILSSSYSSRRTERNFKSLFVSVILNLPPFTNTHKNSHAYLILMILYLIHEISISDSLLESQNNGTLEWILYRNSRVLSNLVRVLAVHFTPRRLLFLAFPVIQHSWEFEHLIFSGHYPVRHFYRRYN